MKSLYYNFDTNYRKNKNFHILGIDEAGRGPLAGPVVAAGVILNPDFDHIEIKDSKKLSEYKRNKLYKIIKKNALKVIVEISWEEEIDEKNILEATIDCFKRIIDNVKNIPNTILIDGTKVPIHGRNIKFIKKGDSKSLSIASASIIAKVTRDNIMKQFDYIFPNYDFKNNKGYGTRKHFEAIKLYGSSPIHRKSFKPVLDFLIPITNLTKRDLDCLGKKYAAISIVKNGFEIKEMNYNKPNIGQIDIIHLENNKLVFSIVNIILNQNSNENSKNFISFKKAKKTMNVSRMYLSEKGFVENVRFDVISVCFSDANPSISRIKNGISF
tara:strand:- start:7334 stop:8314 length:981 start_codon:yes stop_codon:yes gene_type:complete